MYDLLDVSNRDKSLEEWATVSMTTDNEGAQFVKGLTTFKVESEGKKITRSWTIYAIEAYSRHTFVMHIVYSLRARASITPRT